jgi:hypothetical protein
MCEKYYCQTISASFNSKTKNKFAAKELVFSLLKCTKMLLFGMPYSDLSLVLFGPLLTFELLESAIIYK